MELAHCSLCSAFPIALPRSSFSVALPSDARPAGPTTRSHQQHACACAPWLQCMGCSRPACIGFADMGWGLGRGRDGGGCFTAAHVDRRRVQGRNPAAKGYAGTIPGPHSIRRGTNFGSRLWGPIRQTAARGLNGLYTPCVCCAERCMVGSALYTGGCTYNPTQACLCRLWQQVVCTRECADATACGDCVGGQDRIVGLQGLIFMSTPSCCCCQHWMVHCRCTGQLLQQSCRRNTISLFSV
jgi:hypothetical protein